jgi:hypothetical protein
MHLTSDKLILIGTIVSTLFFSYNNFCVDCLIIFITYLIYGTQQDANYEDLSKGPN